MAKGDKTGQELL